MEQQQLKSASIGELELLREIIEGTTFIDR